MSTKARATEQRRVDAIWRAVADIVGEDEATRMVAEVEARREEDDVDWELARKIRDEVGDRANRRRDIG